MAHVFYALFRDSREAEAAIADARASGIGEDHYRLVAHTGPLREDERELSETDLREGVVEGLLAGGVAGGVLAVVFTLFGAVALPLGVAALAGFGFGAFFGAIGGGLSGIGLPDRRLAGLTPALESGGVLVTVEADSSQVEQELETIFLKHGAAEARKPVW